MRWAILVAVALAACTNDTDPRWQLRHDRIVAIRTTPSHVPAGQTAVIDALVTSVDGGPAVQAPSAATATGALAGAVAPDGQGGWQVTAPDAAALDAARAALALAPGAPVPLEMSLRFEVGGETLTATKRAWFGDAQDNPTVGPITVDGAAPAAAIAVPFDADVALAIDQPAADRVNWLTSCGSLNNDDNEHAALLHVNPDDVTAGQLVVTVRDPGDGVAWQIWTMTSVAPARTD
ncbi:MAG TPA: hypothetical protein VHW23_05205 [Kofleriaceae bacterium]|nr:hypothetical protein [Kofleriaceae bacterium]